MNCPSFFSKHKNIIFLILMMITYLTYFTYVFGWQREGFHSDESWSYGYANAYYQKQLYLDNSGDRANFNKWTDSKVFNDYITVQGNQRFSYDSVYHNMSEDFNPPLHSMILHTICSFFPDSFSWWYSYAINVVAFILTMIILYILSKKLTDSGNTALFVCFFYGILSGALNTFIYLRVYALLTPLALLYALLHCQLYKNNFQKPLKCIVGIFFVNIFGGLCHYYFLALVVCFAIFFSLYQLFTKRIKPALLYITAMTLSGGAYLLIWPYAINLIGKSPDMYAAHMPLLWKIKACFQFLIGESTGILIRYPNPYSIAIFNVCLIFLVIIISGFSILFRNEPWFRRAIKIGFLSTKRFLKKLPKRLKNCDKLWFLLTIVCLCTMICIAKISNVFYMGIYFDRYLFFLMPLTTLLTVQMIYKIICKLFKRARKQFRVALIATMTIAGILMNQFYFPCHYLFTRNCDKPFAEEITKDADVIVAVSDDWHIVCYSTLLKDCKQFYMLNMEYDMESLETLNELDSSPDTPVYLIIQKSKLRAKDWEKDENAPEGMVPIADALTLEYKVSDIVDKVSASNFTTMTQYISTESGFVGDYDIYRLR